MVLDSGNRVKRTFDLALDLSWYYNLAGLKKVKTLALDLSWYYNLADPTKGVSVRHDTVVHVQDKNLPS